MLCSGSRFSCFPFFNPMTGSKLWIINYYPKQPLSIIRGTLTYEFSSFRDRARTSICSYNKANFPIINVNAINSFQPPKCPPFFIFDVSLNKYFLQQKRVLNVCFHHSGSSEQTKRAAIKKKLTEAILFLRANY